MRVMLFRKLLRTTFRLWFGLGQTSFAIGVVSAAYVQRYFFQCPGCKVKICFHGKQLKESSHNDTSVGNFQKKHVRKQIPKVPLPTHLVGDVFPHMLKAPV